MSYISLILLIASLYDNIFKISLRKEILDFYEVSKTDYRVKRSPLDEHRDVDMHLNARMSFSRLKYMSQDEFLCNSVNCTKVRDAGCYLVAGIEMKVPSHLICWRG